jgi:hypothetical protein
MLLQGKRGATKVYQARSFQWARSAFKGGRGAVNTGLDRYKNLALFIITPSIELKAKTEGKRK